MAPYTTVKPHSHCKPTELIRTDSAWKTNLSYEMDVFTLHAEPSGTEPDRA